MKRVARFGVIVSQAKSNSFPPFKYRTTVFTIIEDIKLEI